MTLAPTLETFYSIVKQAVIDMDYLPGVQVNTFGLVDDTPDVFGESFGYSFGSYLNGFFWSRMWVLNGADPNKISGEYPALFLELAGSDLEDGTHQISMVLIDKIECSTCPPEIIRTGPAIESNLRRAVRALLAEVDGYVLYDLGEQYQWASPGRMATWDDLPEDEADHLNEYLDLTRASIRRWGDYPELRGVTLTMSLTTCESSVAPFRYYTPTEPLTGATWCGC